MSVASVDYCNLENNENLPINNVKWRVNDQKNNSGSQEIFSDDDHVSDISCNSPKVSVKNNTFNSSIISMKTPTICSRVNAESPGRAIVPKTPTDLLPYIKKTSFLWTSDMETPQSYINEQPRSCDKTFTSINSINKTPTRPKTPPQESMEINPKDVTSPVLGGKKRTKRKVKRRILNNLKLDLDNNNDQESNTSSDKVSSQPTSTTSSEAAIDIQKEVDKCAMKESININNLDSKENKLLEEAVNTEKNSNTSTQDFFSNASFTSIDQLCSTAIKEEPNKPESNSNSSKQVVVESKENNISKSVSNDILERVAAIRKNQKPIMRSTDISNTVIPKEVFSKSVMELELADAKFSQEKKPILNKAKPLALMSFSKLSSLDNDLSNKISDVEKTSLVLNNAVKAISNKNVNSSEKLKENQDATSLEYNITNNKISINSKTTVRKESFEKIYSDGKNQVNNDKFSNVKETKRFNEQPAVAPIEHNLDNIIHQSTDGFSTAKGRDIPINPEKLHLRTKVYQEIEKEIGNEIDLKQKTEQPKKLSTIFGRQSLKEDKKTEKSKLQQDPEVEEFLKSKLSPQDMDVASDGFATARGRKISISEEKENQRLKIYNELSDDIDFSAAKTSNAVKPRSHVINQKSNINIVSSKTPTSSTSTFSDGFETAGGKGITVSEEKLNLYTKICNELSDDIDFGTSKKSNIMKSAVKQPINKNNMRKTEITSSRASTDGFATARGEGIVVSNEKEKQYLQFLNETNDTDEDSLLNIKTNKQFKTGLTLKPKDKVVLTFNPKKSVVTNAKGTEKPTPKSSNNGFSTAKGVDIPTSNDKESYFWNIYNDLSDQAPGESLNNKLPKKPFVASKPIKVETAVVKKENENMDEVFEEIGDLNEFFSPPHQPSTLENIKTDSNFIVPNSSNILQPINGTTIPQTVIKKEVLDHEVVNNSDKTMKTVSTDKPEKNQIGLFKRKLDDSDTKRTGRCRSFGGFPANGEGVTSAKLNKSDPHNESAVNQPLQKCLSISQCFDPHSDSWLSKVDISYLNNSKINSPKVKKQKKDDVITSSNSKSNVPENCLGFFDQEYLQSSRLYGAFETFLRKQYKKYNDVALNIKAGQSITITNPTSSDHRLFLQYENLVEVKRCGEESIYELVETAPKKIESRIVETNIPVVEIGKRKYADTDSDTPLTSVKKPRVGNELQGRKLFSDEDDADDEEHREIKRVESISSQPVQSMEIQPPEAEAEEEEEVDMSEERLSAVLLQEKIIRNKKRLKIKPIIGKLLSERIANSKNRTTWSQLVGSSVPMPLSADQIKQVHSDAKILEVTASNATCYTFMSSHVTGKKNVVSLNVDDEASIIFDQNGRAGVNEFSQAFLAMPGVDPKLLPAGWVENHYRWIVWKLASLDRIQFGSTQLSKNLTPQRVMSELKYRYDREIDKAQRPALRRILEKDDAPTRRMVLCISSIKETAVADETDKEVRTKLGLSRWKIEATDGWYDIPLTVDSAMANYITTGKIKEGTKIITYGAELMECERGFFPLEKPPNVSLKIHTNCTRRAKWDTKLGYQKISRPMPVKLRDIISAGGLIGEITAAAARVYPVLYREKTADGKSIYRNARCEEKAAIAHERAVEKKVDAMYAEAQKNFNSKKKSESDDDFETSQTQISQKFNHYERKQEEFKRRLESQVRQGLPPKRNVTAVLKVRLVDDDTTVILSIWGAGEDSECDIREGDTVSIYNVIEAGRRGGDLHLTAGRITHIKTEPLLKLPYPNRICTLIPDIGIIGFEPKFGEFDTVGIVVSSGSAPYGMKNFEMVNIAYPKPDDSGSSYLSVLFWNGIPSFGYQGMFTPGSFVACSNLEWRRNHWSIAVAYCSEKSVFTSNPRQAHLMKALRNLKALVQNPTSYAESCIEEVAAELTKKPQPRQGTPSSWPNDRSVTFASPADHCSPGNASLRKRLDKLSCYGSSPEISPIVLNSSSTRLKKDFTPVTCRKT